MPGYIDQLFPFALQAGLESGPRFQTDIITTQAGIEDRNALMPYQQMEYNAATVIKTWDNLEALNNWFIAVRGKWIAFPLLDRLDFKSCLLADTPAWNDQILAPATEGQTVFQLYKNYTLGSLITRRPIVKPDSANFAGIGVNGAEVTTGWTLDALTGQVTFDTGLVADDVVSWGGQFFTPVRFDVDYLPTHLTAYQRGEAVVPLIEDLGA